MTFGEMWSGPGWAGGARGRVSTQIQKHQHRDAKAASITGCWKLSSSLYHVLKATSSFTQRRGHTKWLERVHHQELAPGQRIGRILIHCLAISLTFFPFSAEHLNYKTRLLKSEHQKTVSSGQREVRYGEPIDGGEPLLPETEEMKWVRDPENKDQNLLIQIVSGNLDFRLYVFNVEKWCLWCGVSCH